MSSSRAAWTTFCRQTIEPGRCGTHVEELDLSELYSQVRTTVLSSGRPAIDPAILVSLWLYATLEGVGSARLVDRLCRTDLAYLWLLGRVSVNYHTLADFRSEAGAVLDDLLSQSLTGLIASGSVDVRTLAVDGMNYNRWPVAVRSAAGSAWRSCTGRLSRRYASCGRRLTRIRRHRSVG